MKLMFSNEITRLTLRPLWKHLVGFAVFGHSTAHSWHLHSMLIEFRIASRYTSFGMCFTFPLSRNPNLGFKFEGWCDGQAGSRCVNHHIAPKKTTSGLKIYLGWNYPTIKMQAGYNWDAIRCKFGAMNTRHDALRIEMLNFFSVWLHSRSPRSSLDS